MTINYSVKNTGNVPLTMTGSAPGVGAMTCPAGPVGIGATVSCSASKTTSQADVTARGISLTATFVGTPVSGTAASAPATVTVTYTPAAPSISLTPMSVTPSTYSFAGEKITVQYRVANTGGDNLTGLAVTDTYIPALTCDSPVIAWNSSVACTGTYTVRPIDVSGAYDLNFNPVASATSAYTGGKVTDFSLSFLSAKFVKVPTYSVTATTNRSDFSAAGQTITYSIAIKNTGNLNLGYGSFSGSGHLTTLSCPQYGQTAGETVTCTATYTTTAADVAAHVPIVETISITMKDGTVALPAQTATTSVPFLGNPALTVSSVASPTSYASAGQTINYSFLVTNTGNVAVAALSLSDTKATGISCPLTTLAPGANTTCTGGYTTTASDASAGSTISNTVTATATVTAGVLAPATAQSAVTFGSQPKLSATLTVSPNAITFVGETLNLSYAVENTGNTTMSGIVVSGTQPTCLVATLAPGQRTQCNATATVTLADIRAGYWQITPAILAYTPAGIAPNFDFSLNLATKILLVSPAPALSMSMTQNAYTYAAGGSITYSWNVSNTGNMQVDNLKVTDTLGTTITCPASTLPPVSQIVCTGTYTTTADDTTYGRTISNAATVTGTVLQGTAPVATANATDARSTTTHQLSLAVTATPFTGLNQTINYSYQVLRNASGNGAATITLSDTRVTNISCPIASLVPNQSVTCTGSTVSTAADLQAAVIASTTTLSATGLIATERTTTTLPLQATPLWNLARTATPASFTVAGQVINYSFALTNTGSVAISSIAVVDTKAGPATCPATTLAIGSSMTCTASYTSTVADVQAGAGITDTVTATGSVTQGTLAPATATGTVTMTPLTNWAATASMAPATFTAAGQTLTTTLMVNNTGNQPITGITDQNRAFTCPATSLAGGASMTCTSSHATTAADVTSQKFSQLVFFSANGTISVLRVNPAPSAIYSGPGAVSWTMTGIVRRLIRAYIEERTGKPWKPEDAAAGSSEDRG